MDGIRDGQPKWLPLRDITDNNAEIILMKFKQFQDVEGVIRLPDSFKPKKMIVEIKPNNKKLSPVKQRFKWTGYPARGIHDGATQEIQGAED